MVEERQRIRWMPIVNRAIWLLCVIEAARAAVTVLGIMTS